VEILVQLSTAFVLTHNFQGSHILCTSRARLSDSVASCWFDGHRGQIGLRLTSLLCFALLHFYRYMALLLILIVFCQSFA